MIAYRDQRLPIKQKDKKHTAVLWYGDKASRTIKQKEFGE
jgi:hypothetical protein